MMNPAQRIRATIDGLNKGLAAQPALPFGGDNRMQEEAMNTGAAARGIASVRNKGMTLPVARLPG